MVKSLADVEGEILAAYAMKSAKSAGRQHYEVTDDGRLAFQRDKDRIIHSKAFRRLDEKTQVFTAGTGDHYRTRLTHTLEVAQISRDIARRLRLNEDLCEAIALAHDLGHPPFGHAGEEALNEAMSKFGMHFEHNEQSRRVVEKLEKAYPHFDGLNLTFEVLDGMIKHQTAWDQAGMQFKTSAHLEAQVVNLADEIAYTNHDMDDGLRSGLIALNQLKRFELWQVAEAAVFEQYGKEVGKDVYVSRVISSIIALMIADLCRQTDQNLGRNNVKTVEDVKNFKDTLVQFSGKMQKMIKELRQFLYENFYMDPQVVELNSKGKLMIKELFDYYVKHPDKLPRKEKGPEAIKDYIAGMTDSFIMCTYDLSKMSE